MWMNLERLKLEARSEHLLTESAMAWMAPDLTRTQYIEMLQRLHPVVRGWEKWVERKVPSDLAELIQGRRRSHLIEQDLRALGASTVGEPTKFPAERVPGLRARGLRFRASFFAAMYVMEGSTLGGQFVAQHIQTLFGGDVGAYNAYFRGYGDKTSEMWRIFREAMVKLPSEDEADVIAAAKAMLAIFRLWNSASYASSVPHTQGSDLLRSVGFNR
jgi:heme oxygenase